MILTDELRSLLDVPRYGAKAPEPTWADIDAELGKGQQMGYQTVLQFAKVGQMLIEKMGDTPIREFVQRAEHELPRLKQTTCHNYMTLAKNRSLLEAKQPGSQRAALALIADAKRPPAPKAMPAPMPTPAPAATKATPASVQTPSGDTVPTFNHVVARCLSVDGSSYRQDELKEMEKWAKVGGESIEHMVESGLSLDEFIAEQEEREEFTASGFTGHDIRFSVEVAIRCPLNSGSDWLLEHYFDDDFVDQVERLRNGEAGQGTP